MSGEPSPKIEWLKDNQFIQNDEKYTIKNHEDGTCELYILLPHRLDSGKYVIRATNSLGKVELEHIINWKNTDEDMVEEFCGKKKDDRELKKLFRSKYIKEEDWDCYGSGYKSHRAKKEEVDPRKRLRFITHLKDQVIPAGHHLQLKVLCDGSWPQYGWYKEDMPIVHGRKYHMRIKKDGMVELCIKNMEMSDAGTYRLVCQNYTGKIETKAKVTVFDNPFQKVDPPVFSGTISGKIVCEFYVFEMSEKSH